MVFIKNRTMQIYIYRTIKNNVQYNYYTLILKQNVKLKS
jgi:hypothetical protein